MRVKYVGPHDAVDVADLVGVKRGEVVEVSTELGKSLIQQDTWQLVKPPAKKATAKKAAAPTTETAPAEIKES